MKKHEKGEAAPQKPILDIVQLILEERKKREEQESLLNSGSIVFDAANFFLDVNPRGMMYKATFKGLLETLPAHYLKDWELAIERLNERMYVRFKATPYIKGEHELLYLNFGDFKGQESYCIPYVDNVVPFIRGYSSNHNICNFTFAELYQQVQD